MCSSHWFVDAFVELAEEARKKDIPSVLLGLGVALDEFCEEAALTNEQREQISNLANSERQRSSEKYCSE